jgi:hypothetical protein
LLAKRQFNDRRRFGLLFWFNRRDFQRNESWQRDCLLITVKRYPPANDIGIDSVTHRNSCHGNTGLLALLDDLGLEGFRV